MPKHKNYWRKREQEHIKKQIKDDAKIATLIKKNQQETMKEIQKEIDAFYGRYAKAEGITMAEARKRATKLDIESYASKAKRYVKYAHSNDDTIKAKAFTPRAMEEMRLYNMTMKVNRLELLKANIHLETVKMASYEEYLLQEKLAESVKAEYKRQSGILGETIGHNAKQVELIVNASFHNATWSDRLWANQQALRNELNTLINRSIIQGRNPREMARELRKRFDVSTFDSERLMITEIARVQGDVQEDSFRKLGIKQYTWIAESNACPDCSELDGKVFDLDKAEVGYNYIPKHPFCRCSISAVVDRDEFEKDLKARGL